MLVLRRFLTMFLRNEFLKCKKILIISKNIGDLYSIFTMLFIYIMKKTLIIVNFRTIWRDNQRLEHEVQPLFLMLIIIQSLAQSKNSYRQLLNDGIKHSQSRILDGESQHFTIFYFIMSPI